MSKMSEEEIRKKAVMIVEAIKTELAMGTQHFNLKGDLITDEKEILHLLVHNQLQFVPANNYDGSEKGCSDCKNKNTDKCYTRTTGEVPSTCPDWKD